MTLSPIPRTSRRRPRPTFMLAALLAGCATPRPDAPAPIVTIDTPIAEPAWRRIVEPADLGRLSRVQQAWEEALALTRTTGQQRRVRGEGDLLRPQAALSRAALPPGSYRCRLIRIGAVRTGRRAYTASEPYFCFVGAEDGKLSFTQQTGPSRPGGYLYEDGDERQVFLGAAARGREKIPPAYGDNPERDVVAIVERIGNFRYRMVSPWPRSGAIIEILELVASPA